jgi:hypothetical protein
LGPKNVSHLNQYLTHILPPHISKPPSPLNT